MTESPQKQAPVSILTDQIQQKSENSSSNPASFILDNSNKSGLRSPSGTLRQTKYQKLFKLYQNELNKREELGLKFGELEVRKQKYEQMRKNYENKTGQRTKSQENQLKFAQLQKNLNQIRDRNKGQGSAIKKIVENLKQKSARLSYELNQEKKKIICIYDPREKIQGHFKRQEIALIRKFELLGCNIEKIHAQITILQKNRVQMQMTNSNTHAQLEQQLQTKKLELANLCEAKNQYQQNINRKSSQQTENQTIMQAIKKMGLEYSQKLSKIDALKDSISNILAGINPKGEDKRKTKLNKIQKELHQIEQSLQKLKNQKNNAHSALEKTRKSLEQKVSQAPPEYQQLRAKGLAIKAQIAKISSTFITEQAKQTGLVPPKIIEQHEQRLIKTREYYDENKLIGQQIKRLERQNKELDEKKQNLQWNSSPTLKLQQLHAKQLQKIKDLQKQIKQLQKESNQVSRRLQQYQKQYPQFQLQRKKKKSQKKQQKKQKQKQNTEESLKKKKPKNKQKSPEVNTIQAKKSQKQEYDPEVNKDDKKKKKKKK